MSPSPKALLPHIGIIALFILTALLYFYPVLQGKAIFQSDIAQYKGMAQERDAHRNQTGEESYWTNSAFGGMPTYQLGAQYPHDYIKKLDKSLRFLPRPADYLFLYLIGCYILMLCLNIEYRLAALGALAFGFSTYLIIILGVGHNAKAHALGYLPIVIGGVVLVFQRKYLPGFLLTTIALSLEISTNHYQMTYYGMLLILIIGIVHGIAAVKDKTIRPFLKSVGLLVLAVGLAVATNATPLMATQEYAQWSTRGASDLTVNPEGQLKTKSTGLDRAYITQYSYGIAESLNLFVPRLWGGSGSEDLGKSSKAYAYLTAQGVPPSQALAFCKGLPLYWGNQPIVAAPAYIGAVVCFLFVLGLFLVQGIHKWWLLAGTVIALLLSWGKNFPVLTNTMIDYFPLYNKFRAVASIQVILELCIPILGILGLHKLLQSSISLDKKRKALQWSFISCLGVSILLFLLKGAFDFTGIQDSNYRIYFGEALLAMIQQDRESVYIADTLRSLIYVALAATVLWLFLKQKISKNKLILSVGILLLFDLWGVAKRYVNTEDFVHQSRVSTPFQATALEQSIRQDTTVYRVFDLKEELNGARTSYFHHSLGGYHAAKPRHLQELFDYHLYQDNMEVLHMLNVKYIIQQDQQGNRFPVVNEQANGNAWFVERLLPVTSADEAIQQLNDCNTKKEAIFNTVDYRPTIPLTYTVDTSASVTMVDYQPDKITYKSNNPQAGFAVFSEMHYPKGWNAFIDGRPAPHYKVNYALRGMLIPAGIHEIVFKFTPQVVKTGSIITLISCIVLALLIAVSIAYTLRNKS